jgi:glutamate 5-kinase
MEDRSENVLPRSLSTASLDLDRRTPLHTRFLPSPNPVRDRTFWILHGLKPHGTVYIDSGAHKALMNKAGLLPVGVVDVEGSFAQQESVRIVAVERPLDGRPSDRHGLDVGRALVNYSSTEIARIKGHQSKEVKDLLGYADSEYVAERENISFFRRESRPQTPIRDLEPLVHGITEYESHA